MQLLLMVVISDEGGGPWLTRTRTPLAESGAIPAPPQGFRLNHGERGGPGDGHGEHGAAEHGQDGKDAADGLGFMMVSFRYR